MNKERKRTLYGKQPARVVVADLSSPFSSSVGHDVCEAMENLFAVACSFNGPCRIPFFSIIVLQENIEILLPFSYVKNNFPRIQSAISDLRQMLADQTHKCSTCFEQGLQEAVNQYKKQLHSSLQTGGICQQLEIVVVTCQSPTLAQKKIEAAAASLEIDNIKRLQVLSLYTGVSLEELGSSQSSSGSTNDHCSSTSHLSNTGLVDMINVEPELLCLQNFFNHWLLDSSADSEHLHLILPPASNTESNLELKCDLQERLLHPAQLPYYSQFTFHADSSQMKMVFPCTSKALGVQMSIYRLHVVSLLPRAAVCDSIVFGMPMLVLPTSCWRVEWDDLERNQQQFRALCHSLVTKDEVLVCQLQPPETEIPHRAGALSHQQPYSYFMLLPSENGSLLVKSLAVQELMLPSAGPSRTDAITEECRATVEGSLEQLERVDGYNPLTTPGQLYECLKNKHIKSTTQRPLKRSQGTPSTSNRVVSSKVRKSQKQRQQLEMRPVTHESDCLFETPLAKRLESRVAGHTKRSLYSGTSDTLLGEDDGDEEMWQQPYSFPTTL